MVVVEVARVMVIAVVVGNVVFVVVVIVVEGVILVFILVVIVFVVIVVVVVVVIGAFVVIIVVVVFVMVLGVVIVVLVVVVVTIVATTPFSHPGGRTSSVIEMSAVVLVRVIITFWYWVITLVIWMITVINSCMLELICVTSIDVHAATFCFTMTVVLATITAEFPMRLLEVYSFSTAATSVM